jgi:hypothetical protein
LVHEGGLLNKYNAGFFGDLKSEKVIIFGIARLYKLWNDGKLPEGSLEFRSQYGQKNNQISGLNF